MKSEYFAAVDWLFQQFPAFQKKGAMAYHPTLDNVRELVEHFNINLEKLKFIHVAGTNGKGSTCAYIAAALTTSNYSVGLFTSPHIYDFRERIRINGEKISEDLLVEFVEQLQVDKLNCKPSFFELTWVLGLKHFQNNNCDFVVVETGLGGRLDATNIITPLITAITNIGLDHQKILGETKEEIALEKAGIIKPNIPLVLGEKDEKLVALISAVAKKKNSEVFTLKTTSKSFQKQNQLLAKNVLQVLVDQGFISLKKNSFEYGVKNVFDLTGVFYRLQRISERPTLIFDVAHNSDGVSALFDEIKRMKYDKLHLIYGASNDKNVADIIKIFPATATCYFTSFSNERSFRFDDLKKETENLIQQKSYFEDINSAIANAKQNASNNDLIVVFGSFFMFEDIIPKH